MAKEIRVTLQAVVEVPDDWKPSANGTGMVTPKGEEVGFLLALEYDYDSAGCCILENDESMRKVGCQVTNYNYTEVDE